MSEGLLYTDKQVISTQPGREQKFQGGAHTAFPVKVPGRDKTGTIDNVQSILLGRVPPETMLI